MRRPALLLLGAALVVPSVGAQDADPVVVRVGDQGIRQSEIAQRFGALPSFQAKTMGASPVEARRRFIDEALVPELLMAAEANRLGLRNEVSVRYRVQMALRRTLVDSLRAEVQAEGVPDADVRAYYDAHSEDFQKPERIRISRIVVDDEPLARKILREASGTLGPEKWNALAREHSVDAATKMRGGQLGFVYPDGRTEVPQVALDPALYAAAAKVKDGEVGREPVKEGARFSVIWRRGTLPKVERSFESAQSSIRELLVRKRTEERVGLLRDALRTKNVKDVDTNALESFKPEVPALAGKPPVVAASSSASPEPRPTERGLR